MNTKNKLIEQVKNSKTTIKSKDKLTVVQLKDLCVKFNQMKTGKKDEIIDRLLNYLEPFKDDDIEIIDDKEGLGFDVVKQEHIQDQYVVDVVDLYNNRNVYHISTIFNWFMIQDKYTNPVTGFRLSDQSIRNLKSIFKRIKTIDIILINGELEYSINVDILMSMEKLYIEIINKIYNKTYKTIIEYYTDIKTNNVPLYEFISFNKDYDFFLTDTLKIKNRETVIDYFEYNNTIYVSPINDNTEKNIINISFVEMIDDRGFPDKKYRRSIYYGKKYDINGRIINCTK